MARILRGDIYLADLNPIIGCRQAGALCPVLIISHTVFNERSGTVIAVVVTRQPQLAGFPLSLELTNSELPKQLWVKTSQIRTLSVKCIGKRIGGATPEELSLVIDGFNEIIGG